MWAGNSDIRDIGSFVLHRVQGQGRLKAGWAVSFLSLSLKKKRLCTTRNSKTPRNLTQGHGDTSKMGNQNTNTGGRVPGQTQRTNPSWLTTPLTSLACFGQSLNTSLSSSLGSSYLLTPTLLSATQSFQTISSLFFHVNYLPGLLRHLWRPHPQVFNFPSFLFIPTQCSNAHFTTLERWGWEWVFMMS